MKDITLPSSNGMVNNLYVRPIGHLFSSCGYSVGVDSSLRWLRGRSPKTKYEAIICGKKVVIDFSNHNDAIETDVPCFKFHYQSEYHKEYKNLYPITQPSISNWDLFDSCARKNVGGGKAIRFQQKSYANAKQRRDDVRLVVSKFSENNMCSFSIVPQNLFFEQAKSTLCGIFVPGADYHMLDKAQLQYMGLGVCTISAEIKTELPWHTPLQPWIHYVPCDRDYNDLEERINYCINNPKLAYQIGLNGKSLFDEYCRPQKAVKYIEKIIGVK